MSITVALIGRTNVGKSTLFNQLTKTHDALTADFSGVTRDLRYGNFQYGKQLGKLIDTGGLHGMKDEFSKLIEERVEHATKTADILGLVVDGRIGLLPQDTQIAESLRKLNKPVLCIVNKVDGDELVADAMFEFMPLGFPIYPVSAIQNRGVGNLMSAIDNTVQRIKPNTEQSIAFNTSPTLKIAIIGRPNVGKSTLVNQLIGEKRQLVSNQSGTTRDSIAIDFSYKGEQYTLIDTAGIRRMSNIISSLEKAAVHQSFQSLKDSFVIMLVIDATLGITDQDLRLLQHTTKVGRAVVVLCNKWDRLTQEERLIFQKDYKRRLRFAHFIPVGFISGLYGTGLSQIGRLAKEVYTHATQKLNTSQITRLLQEAVQAVPPSRGTKLRYAHPGGYNPPVIVIHGTRVQDISVTYKRYLQNFYHKQLKMIGTPLKIEFREKQRRK